MSEFQAIMQAAEVTDLHPAHHMTLMDEYDLDKAIAERQQALQDRFDMIEAMEIW